MIVAAMGPPPSIASAMDQPGGAGPGIGSGPGTFRPDMAQWEGGRTVVTVHVTLGRERRPTVWKAKFFF